MRTKDYNDVATILENIASKFEYGQASIDAEPGDTFFEDACKFVGVITELHETARHFRAFGRYREILGRD